MPILTILVMALRFPVERVYEVSDGASIQWDIGYLAWEYDSSILDEGSEDPFGTALTLNVSF